MVQKARPVADVSNDGWAPTPVYAQVNEPTFDDGSHVTAPALPAASFVVRLGALAPPGTGPGLPAPALTVRIKGPGTVLVELLQNEGLVAARTYDTTGAYDAYTMTLTAAEAVAILWPQDGSDPNLRVRVTAYASSSSSSSGSSSGSCSSSSVSLGCTHSPSSGTAPLLVAFGATPAGGVPPYTYLWDFDDGATSTAQNPSHTYAIAGTYAPSVTVSDACGNLATCYPGTITVTATENHIKCDCSCCPDGTATRWTFTLPEFTGNVCGCDDVTCAEVFSNRTYVLTPRAETTCEWYNAADDPYNPANVCDVGGGVLYNSVPIVNLLCTDFGDGLLFYLDITYGLSAAGPTARYVQGAGWNCLTGGTMDLVGVDDDPVYNCCGGSGFPATVALLPDGAVVGACPIPTSCCELVPAELSMTIVPDGGTPIVVPLTWSPSPDESWRSGPFEFCGPDAEADLQCVDGFWTLVIENGSSAVYTGLIQDSCDPFLLTGTTDLGNSACYLSLAISVTG